MAIVEQVYKWYEQHIDRFLKMGVRVDLRPPIEPDRKKGFMRSCPQIFEFRGNELYIFLWEAGHLQIEVYRAAAGEVEDEYHRVESGSEACVIIEKWLEEFASLPPGPSLKEVGSSRMPGKPDPGGGDHGARP